MSATTPRHQDRQPDAQVTLTPSEQVLLDGERFAAQPAASGRQSRWND